MTEIISHLITTVFCLFIVYASGGGALRALSDDTMLSTVPVLIAPAYCLVPLGFLALLVMLLIDQPRVSKGNSFLFGGEAPPAS